MSDYTDFSCPLNQHCDRPYCTISSSQHKNHFRQKITDSTFKIELYKNSLIASLLFYECKIELHHQSPSVPQLSYELENFTNA